MDSVSVFCRESSLERFFVHLCTMHGSQANEYKRRSIRRYAERKTTGSYSRARDEVITSKYPANYFSARRERVLVLMLALLLAVLVGRDLQSFSIRQ
jgi:hypothetical protein